MVEARQPTVARKNPTALVAAVLVAAVLVAAVPPEAATFPAVAAPMGVRSDCAASPPDHSSPITPFDRYRYANHAYGITGNCLGNARFRRRQPASGSLSSRACSSRRHIGGLDDARGLRITRWSRGHADRRTYRAESQARMGRRKVSEEGAR